MRPPVVVSPVRSHCFAISPPTSHDPRCHPGGHWLYGPRTAEDSVAASGGGGYGGHQPDRDRPGRRRASVAVGTDRPAPGKPLARADRRAGGGLLLLSA